MWQRPSRRCRTANPERAEARFFRLPLNARRSQILGLCLLADLFSAILPGTPVETQEVIVGKKGAAKKNAGKKGGGGKKKPVKKTGKNNKSSKKGKNKKK